MAVALALMATVLLSSAMLPLLSIAQTELKISRNHYDAARALATAESGQSLAYVRLNEGTVEGQFIATLDGGSLVGYSLNPITFEAGLATLVEVTATGEAGTATRTVISRYQFNDETDRWEFLQGSWRQASE